jgi:hypothetical protein
MNDRRLKKLPLSPDGRHDKTRALPSKMPAPLRILALGLVCTALSASAEEPLPLPTSLLPPVPQNNGFSTPSSGILPRVEVAPQPTGFIKPTKSIKPPTATTAVAGVDQSLPPPVQIVSTPAPDTRLRRLVVVDASMSPQAIREAILASTQGRLPVTVSSGVTAPAPVLTDLAGLFGSTANADTQQKVLDTVKKGMGSASKPLKRVEVVGWVPSQGVMAVVVYPES